MQILKTQKMHFLKQIVFEKASSHYFSAGNGVLKNDRFCARFFRENTNWEKIVPTSQL